MTRAEMIGLLEEGKVSFPPPELVAAEGGVLEARWGERKARFAVECRSLDTPKVIEEAISAARRRSNPPGLFPLILVPFLSREQLATLEAEAVSGLDLCGNGLLIVPNELLVYRTGGPNRFPRSGLIKNVYRGASSTVARAFLLVPKFDAMNGVWEEVRRRGGGATPATVSKVCGALESDLIVERWRDKGMKAQRARLLQPEKLLERLEENYAPPEVTATFTGKVALTTDELRRALADWGRETNERIVLTGACSVEAYAVMARAPVQDVYCSDVAELVKWLGERARETTRFANLNLLETADERVYFDARPGLLASPIQTYLELATSDKRDRQTAEQVRRVILAALEKASGLGGVHESARDEPARSVV